ncbi:hypothetical protein J6590_024790 [Homalodisca vitripennis]|nr:hypothetical protein J6590_024790 [Homalodisca vitripennis]
MYFQILCSNFRDKTSTPHSANSPGDGNVERLEVTFLDCVVEILLATVCFTQPHNTPQPPISANSTNVREEFNLQQLCSSLSQTAGYSSYDLNHPLVPTAQTSERSSTYSNSAAVHHKLPVTTPLISTTH